MAVPNKLARPSKGSALRPDEGGGYKSLVAIGATAANTSLADATTSSAIECSTAEAGHIAKFVCDATIPGAAPARVTSGVSITSIKHNNDEMVTGYVPISVFAQDSVASPMFGHWVDVNDVISVTFRNETGATVELSFAFTV
jgi:hypothetical protein